MIQVTINNVAPETGRRHREDVQLVGKAMSFQHGSLPFAQLEFGLQTAAVNKHTSSKAWPSKVGVYALLVGCTICTHSLEHTALCSTWSHEHALSFRRASAAVTVCVFCQARYLSSWAGVRPAGLFSTSSPVNIITELPRGLTLKSESFKKSMHVSSQRAWERGWCCSTKRERSKSPEASR